MHDVGNKEQIKNYAMQYGAEIVEMELESQFRCNGSDSYLAWLDDVLGIRDTANFEDLTLNMIYKYLMILMSLGSKFSRKPT